MISWPKPHSPAARTQPTETRRHRDATEKSEPAWPGEGNTNADPRFVRPGMRVVPPGDEAPAWISGDYRLQSGSPCIDAGTSEGAPATDIEGDVRPCGKGVEIGAFEYCPLASAEFRRGDPNADGATDISDAVAILGYLFLGSTMNDCKDAADVNDDGKVDISDPVRLRGHLFLGSERPPDPFGTCGMDPTADGLDCNTFSKCP